MSDKPADAAAPPPKSKKLLLIVGVVVLLLALAAAGGWFYVNKQRAALDAEEEPAVAKMAAKGPPVYLPLDNLVVNLADPGSDSPRASPIDDIVLAVNMPPHAPSPGHAVRSIS